MTYTTTASTLALAISLLGFGCAMPSFAQTGPGLKIADGLGNGVTVTSAGPVCAGTCSTSNVAFAPGSITWSGNIGAFTVFNANGRTKPALPAPNLDFGIGNISTFGTAGGTITITWSDTGFFGSAPTAMNTLTTFASGTGSVNYKYYTDDTNVVFGTGTLVGTMTVSSSGTQVITGTGPSLTPFTMTEVEVITLSPDSFFINDDSMQAAPNAPLTLACATSSGQVGIPYNSNVSVTGGLAPYTYTIISGSLPSGLSLGLSSGAISGTPSFAGNYSFTVQVVDSTGMTGSNTATSACGINVVPPNPTSLMLSCPVGAGAAGVAYNSSLVATGGTSPYSFSSGTLPVGLSLNALTGAITGVPTAAGSIAFSARVVDSSRTQLSVTTNCTIVISASGSPVTTGDTATIGFWHNQNGQALIKALNGGPTSTVLGGWLAAQYPYLYGSTSIYNMAGKTNADIASRFLVLFGGSGQKTNAQILAGALASYVTSSTLAGTSAVQYGFNSSPDGTWAKTYNVGTYGTAIGLSNNQSYTVSQLLAQANTTQHNGTFNANAFNSIFSGINQTGDIK